MVKFKIFIALFIALSMLACSDADNISSDLASKLKKNESWPYEVVGVVHFDEGSGFDDDTYTWGVGYMNTDSEFSAIGVIYDQKHYKGKAFDFEGEKVRVWLDKPNDEHGALYVITNVEKI
ncbi:MAG: hypothetical protein D6B27_03500 [Gammaproteobacteria bacterium]|mgnify:CR=1 FL=1|nr:MAG: hypothetical protein D6B27_03500 [Gammaproteobacteria bacterium]